VIGQYDEDRVLGERRPDGTGSAVALGIQAGRPPNERVDRRRLTVGHRPERLEDGTLLGRDRQRDLDVLEVVLGLAGCVGLDAVQQFVLGLGVRVGRRRDGTLDELSAGDAELHRGVEGRDRSRVDPREFVHGGSSGRPRQNGPAAGLLRLAGAQRVRPEAAPLRSIHCCRACNTASPLT
jgi:hypothetical protein